MVVYAASGKMVNERLDFRSETERETGRIMKLDQILKGCCTHSDCLQKQAEIHIGRSTKIK
jgi:hypothetical protein